MAMASGVCRKQVVMTPINWHTLKTAFGTKKMGIISYENRVIANTTV